MSILSRDLKMVKVLLITTGWFLWILENCIKYMSKNAYIQIALTGNSFFKSAWNAFTLILKHADNFGFGHTIGSVFMFFGCITISASVSGFAYLFMTL